MTRRSIPLAALLAIAAAPAGAQALEPIVVYDNFSTPQIDPDLWPGNTERVKEIVNGKLHMRTLDYADTAIDDGVISANLNHAFPDPAAVTAMRARIVVGSYASIGCSLNSLATQARVRLVGSFFNTGTPIPGNQTGDVIAQMRVSRISNSQDAPNALRVDASLLRCADATCTVQTLYQNPLPDFGTVTLGQPITLQMQWDKANKRVLFTRDGGTPLAISYGSDADGQPPSNEYKHLRLSAAVPRCTVAPRPVAGMDVTFDNVSVNKSARP